MPGSIMKRDADLELCTAPWIGQHSYLPAQSFNRRLTGQYAEFRYCVPEKRES